MNVMEQQKQTVDALSPTGRMRLRDEFAMAAMQGILGFGGPDMAHPDYIAQWSYDIAGAMMQERDARTE